MKITTPVAKLKYPGLKVQTKEPSGDALVRIQAISSAEAAGAFEGVFEIDSEGLARAAKAAYQVFVKEAGFQNDARIVDWERLQAVHQRRWEAIARAVIEASRSAGGLGGEDGVQHNDAGPRRIRPRNTKASAQVPTNRNRGARRR